MHLHDLFRPLVSRDGVFCSLLISLSESLGLNLRSLIMLLVAARALEHTISNFYVVSWHSMELFDG